MKKLLFGFALVFWAFSSPALLINVTYDTSVTSLTNAAQVEASFNSAVQTFQAIYTNNITVNITSYWGNAGPFSGGINLGASYFWLIGSTYSGVTNALHSHRTSAVDFSSVASLPPSDPTGGPWWVPRAECKALGLVSANDTSNDGSVGFASDVSYTFDPTNRAVAGKYDFIGVAEHEISEVLGRVYGLNYNFGAFVPYDLFRFTNGVRCFDPNANNVYFSVDNGATQLKQFYPDPTMGDIQDWETSATPDSFDAFVSTGSRHGLSSADITALDVLGYNTSGVTPPDLAITKSNTSFRVSFAALPGSSFTILATTNVSLSISSWTVLGTATENPDGQFQFTDSNTSTNSRRFYRARAP